MTPSDGLGDPGNGAGDDADPVALSADVVIVGAGNSASCAALAAAERGASVLMLERAPFDERGGNTRFTAGSMRVVYDGLDDILELVPDLTPSEIETSDFGTYPAETFMADLARMTEWRTDPDLADLVVSRSHETLKWMRSKGVRFVPIYHRQAYRIDGRFKFWGGLTIEAAGGGPGLVDALAAATEAAGVKTVYDARALRLLADDDGVWGLVAKIKGRTCQVRARSVVLAAGGSEANPEWRSRYLGSNWELAKVRGTRFNTGDGIRMALDIGAAPYGQWSGAHAVSWDRNASEFGDLAIGDHYQKHSYPLGIMVNAEGRRFVDEGADFRNYTYARYGREVLAQTAQMAWQVFDARVTDLLRQEYRIRQVTKVSADSLDELAHKLEGVDPEGFLEMVAAYNAAIDQDVAFNPNVLDGRGTRGVVPAKTNWANPIDTPPFEAYQVTCGVTFTFGGLRVSTGGAVLDEELAPIGGLFACGELVGGLFYFNYPGGSGLTAGSVIGRAAGANAAGVALARGAAEPARVDGARG